MSDIVEQLTQWEHRCPVVMRAAREEIERLRAVICRENDVSLLGVRAATIEQCAQINDMCALNTFTAEEGQAALHYAGAKMRALKEQK